MRECTPVQELSQEVHSCPVCGGHETSFLRDAFDDRYGHPGRFHLARCLQCEHIMTQPMLREQDLASLYGTYYLRKSLSSAAVVRQAQGAASALGKLKRWVMGANNQGQYSARRGERMLDVGCGSGLSLLEAREFGVEAWGIEADPNVERIARELGLRIHQGSLKDRPFGDLAFDLVVLNQVIEHIPEPDQALRLIRSRLATGGRAILVFPNVQSIWSRLAGPRWINWHIPYHLHHFTKQTFTQMAQRCGYRVVSSRTITPNVWTILQLHASRQIATRGKPGSLWSTSGGTVAKTSVWDVRRLLRRLLVLPMLATFSIINRCVDALGWGDSLMVEIRPLEQE